MYFKDNQHGQYYPRRVSAVRPPPYGYGFYGEGEEIITPPTDKKMSWTEYLMSPWVVGGIVLIILLLWWSTKKEGYHQRFY